MHKSITRYYKELAKDTLTNNKQFDANNIS